jgi:hypothetical protein
MVARPTLTELRARLTRMQEAVVARDYHPDQPRTADGRFGSTGGKPVDLLLNPGDDMGKYAKIIAKAAGNEEIVGQCSHCSRMLSGPLAGKRIGVIVRKNAWTTGLKTGFSHGVCRSCQKDWLIDVYTKKGLTPEQATARATLFQAGKPIPDDLRTEAEKAQRAMTPDEAYALLRQAQAARLQLVRTRLALHILRVRMADETRYEGGLNGRIPLFAMGADGKMHFAGSTPGAGKAPIPTSPGHLHIPGVTHVAHTDGKGGGVKASGKHGAKTPSVADLHHASRAWQAANPHTPETPPTPVDQLVLVQPVDMREIDPYTHPDAHRLASIFGEHQVGAAISNFTVSTLQQMAKSLGISTTGMRSNHDALVSVITAHVTNGHYSADFGTQTATGKTAGTKAQSEEAGRFPAARIEELKNRALYGDKTAQEEVMNLLRDHFHDPESKSVATDSEKAARAADLMLQYRGRYEREQSGYLTDNGRPLSRAADPALFWHAAGGDPELMELMLKSGVGGMMPHYLRQHPDMLGMERFNNGQVNRDPSPKEIVQALQLQHDGKVTWRVGSDGGAPPNPADPRAANYLADMARLRETHAAYLADTPAVAKAHDAATKAARGGTKAKEPTANQQLRINQHQVVDRLVPIQTGLRFNAFNLLDDASLTSAHRTFGSDQLKDAIYANPTADLRAKAQEMGIYRAGMTHEDLARTIAAAWIAKEGHIDGPPSHLDEILAQTSKPDAYTGADLVPISSAVGYNINVYGPPQEDILLKIYGAEQLPKALSLFSTPKLKEAVDRAMTKYPGTKPASRTKREDLIAYLVQQAVHPGEPMPGASAGKDLTGLKPSGAATLAILGSQLLQLKDPGDPIEAWHHFGGTAESLRAVLYEEPIGYLRGMLMHPNMPPGPSPRGKSRQVLADNIVKRLDAHFNPQPPTSAGKGLSGLKPSGVAASPADPYHTMSPHDLLHAVGEAQFHEALSRMSTATLREMAKTYAIPTGRAKRDMVDAIEQWTKAHPEMAGVYPTKGSTAIKDSATRMTLPDLAAKLAHLRAAARM